MTYINSFCDVLKKRLIETGRVSLDQITSYKVKHINDNFFETMTESVEQQYLMADGGEIDSGKMEKIRSSSAMIYNLLGNSNVEVKENKKLPSGIYNNNFEVKLKTLETSSRKANLDARLFNDDAEIFIESKCLEWLENGSEKRLKDSYFKTGSYVHDESANLFVKTARLISCSQYDSCQMFKHTLAIFNDLIKRKISKKIILLNLVWELPDGEKLESNYLERYKLQERLEHLEFQYFYENMKDIIQIFSTYTNCSFDIKYMTVKEFCSLLSYSSDKLKYIQRYL